MGRPALAVVCLLAGSCASSSELGWRFEADETVETEIEVIVAQIRRGGCDAEEPVYEAVLTPEQPATIPPQLRKGVWGFAGEARNGFCEVIARGCAERQLPSGGEGEVVVHLDALDTPRFDCRGGVCAQGQCTRRQPAVCDYWSPSTWTPPRPLKALNTPHRDFDAAFAPDGLRLYFSSDRPGGEGESDLWVTERDGLGSPWGPPRVVPGVNSSEQESSPSLSVDLLQIIFASDREGSQVIDLWIATRDSADEPFDEPSLLPGPVNTRERERDPFLSWDLERLYFVRSFLADGNDDLYLAGRDDPDDDFGEPIPLPGTALQTEWDEGDPSLTADERVLVFDSDRPGGSEDNDLWLAMRDGVDEEFGAPSVIPELSSDAEDTQAALAADGCEVIFASSRGDDERDLYRSFFVQRPD